MERDAVLVAYDREVRCRPQSDDPRYSFGWDGAVYRMLGPGSEAYENCVLFSDLNAHDAQSAIDRQVAYFEQLGHAFEWKLHAHDNPADLATRLTGTGFSAEPEETLVVSDLQQPVAHCSPPAGVVFSELHDPDEFGVIADVEFAIYGDEQRADRLAESLAAEKRERPDAVSLHVAKAGREVVAIGRASFPSECAFAGLWGGATLPEWRGRGIYTALVERRLAQARERGYRWVTVDCTDQSLPILECRGFHRLVTTTPWIWAP